MGRITLGEVVVVVVVAVVVVAAAAISCYYTGIWLKVLSKNLDES
jgi:hypothetical protein